MALAYIALFLFMALGSTLIVSARSGKECVKWRRKGVWRYTQRSLSSHETCGTIALALMIAAIAAIKLLVRTRHVAVHHWLFVTHVFFAVPFFAVLLLLRFWLTGLRWKHHGALAYICLALYSGAFITGVIMLREIITKSAH